MPDVPLIVIVAVALLIAQEIFDRRIPGESWLRRVVVSVGRTFGSLGGFFVGSVITIGYPVFMAVYGLWTAARERSIDPLLGVAAFFGVLLMAALGLMLWQGGIAYVVGTGYGPALGLALAALLVGAAWQSVRVRRS